MRCPACYSARMESAALEVGRLYAYRENPRSKSDMLKVKLIAKVGRGGKVKIRFEDGPHPGLEEYVRTANIIVSWGDRKAVLRDEERSQRIDEYAQRSSSDHAIVEAVSSILESSGEPSAGAAIGGLSMPEAELARIMRRAGLEGGPTTLHHLAFRNRRGDVEMPLDGAETLARAFAAAEPETVLDVSRRSRVLVEASGLSPWRSLRPRPSYASTCPDGRLPASGQGSIKKSSNSRRRSDVCGSLSRRRPTISAMPGPKRSRAGSSALSTAADLGHRQTKPARTDERTTTDDARVEQLRDENAALRTELERLRARYEGPIEPPAETKTVAREPEPEPFGLVGPGERERHVPSDEALDSVGQMLCGMLEERQPGTRWRYYRDERLVPHGVTFFYAHEALRKLWGQMPGDPEPPNPQAYRRLAPAEHDEHNTVLRAALNRVDDALQRSQDLHAQGQVRAAVGLLKYVDLLLARFNLALAQARAGNGEWQDALNDQERDFAFEEWLAHQLTAG